MSALVLQIINQTVFNNNVPQLGYPGHFYYVFWFSGIMEDAIKIATSLFYSWGTVTLLPAQIVRVPLCQGFPLTEVFSRQCAFVGVVLMYTTGACFRDK